MDVRELNTDRIRGLCQLALEGHLSPEQLQERWPQLSPDPLFSLARRVIDDAVACYPVSVVLRRPIPGVWDAMLEREHLELLAEILRHTGDPIRAVRCFTTLEDCTFSSARALELAVTSQLGE